MPTLKADDAPLHAATSRNGDGIPHVCSDRRAAVAGPLEDAEAAWSRHDYATAFRVFRSLAEQGDVTAQKRLGDMYEQGQSVPQDYALAVLWYRRAADQGFKEAQWLLGTYYQTGYGVQQDYVQAHMWYNLSAAQGWGAAAENRTMLERAMTPGAGRGGAETCA